MANVGTSTMDPMGILISSYFKFLISSFISILLSKSRFFNPRRIYSMMELLAG